MMVIPRTDITLRPNASNKPSGNKPWVINCEINNDIDKKKKTKKWQRESDPLYVEKKTFEFLR